MLHPLMLKLYCLFSFSDVLQSKQGITRFSKTRKTVGIYSKDSGGKKNKIGRFFPFLAGNEGRNSRTNSGEERISFFHLSVDCLLMK